VSKAVKKLKECPSCGNRQTTHSGVFTCNECNCTRSAGGVKNYYKLRDKYLNEEFIEEWKNLEADDYSEDASKIKRAIENLDEEVRSQ